MAHGFGTMRLAGKCCGRRASWAQVVDGAFGRVRNGWCGRSVAVDTIGATNTWRGSLVEVEAECLNRKEDFLTAKLLLDSGVIDEVVVTGAGE